MPTVASLFSGIGGIDLGFENAGFETVFANEIDPDACKTYRYNFPKSYYLLEENIRNIDTSCIPQADVLTAGFPCQPFSVCGKKKGFDDERGDLFFEIIRIARFIQPKVVFLENVANLLKHNDGRTFEIIRNSLGNIGYHIRWKTMDACNYGIAQHRTRIYIVAFREDLDPGVFEFPEAENEGPKIFDVLNRYHQADAGFYLDRGTWEYNQLLKFIDDDQQIYRFSDYGIQKSSDGISFTLKANMGTWYNRIPYIKDEFGIRMITPEECLLLQGFPYGFLFPDDIPIKSAYKQAGNTVCVPIINQIAQVIIGYL